MRWFHRKPKPTHTPPPMMTVTLQGGPMDGQSVEVAQGTREVHVPYLLNGAVFGAPNPPRFGNYVYRQVPVFVSVEEGEG